MEQNQMQDTVKEIREKYPKAGFPDVYLQPVFFGRKNLTMVKDRQAVVVKYPDKEPFAASFCSPAYQLIPFEVSVKKLEETADILADQHGPYKIGINIINETKLRVGAQFEKRTPLKKGDEMVNKMGFQSSYDMGWQHTPFFSAIRLVCTNGMTANIVEKLMGHKHNMALDLDQQSEMLLEGASLMKEQEEVWQAWGEKEIPAVMADEILVSLDFGKRRKEEILALPEASTGETLSDWISRGTINALNFYNVLTQFITHDIESDMVRISKGAKVAEKFTRILQ